LRKNHIGIDPLKKRLKKLSYNPKSQIDGFFSELSYRDNRSVSCIVALKTNDYVGFAAYYDAYGQNIIYASRFKESAIGYKEVTADR
jgi:hypothetical protein